MTCIDCSNEVVAGRQRCEHHLAKAREAQKRHRALHGDAIRSRVNERYRTNEAFRESRKAASNRARQHDPVLNRRNNLRRNYGMTLGDWETLFLFQGQRCALCFGDKPGGRGSLHTDHDHETGNVRGLLCHWCNTSLERAELSGWLKRAMDYLGVEFA